MPISANRGFMMFSAVTGTVEPTLNDFFGRFGSVGYVLADQFFSVADGAHPIRRRVSCQVPVFEIAVPGHVVSVPEGNSRQGAGQLHGRRRTK